MRKDDNEVILGSPIFLADRLAALAPLAPDNFFRIVIEGAARVLQDTKNPIRLNLFSAAIRMLFEHVMGTLAPNHEVEACSWYNPVKDQSKPVRRQRIQYWLQGGLSDQFLEEDLGANPNGLRQRLTNEFEKLSKHVHGRADTIVYDRNKQEAEAEATIDAVEALLRAYHDCREALLAPLVESLDDNAVDNLLSETILSVDELASHHSVDEIYVDRTEVSFIGSSIIRYRATGYVSVTLQWGSNSDLRRGDGAEMEASFPFECHFDVPIDDPCDLRMAEIVSSVDTSSWCRNDLENFEFDKED